MFFYFRKIKYPTLRNQIFPLNKYFLILIFCNLIFYDLSAGDYGDVYGAHPAAAGMGNAVTAIVNNSSAVYYNVAGLGRLSEGDLLVS